MGIKRYITKVYVDYVEHVVRANEQVLLTFQIDPSNINGLLGILKTMGHPTKLFAKVGSKKLKLGSFDISKSNIYASKACSIQFTSVKDYVELDNFSQLNGLEPVMLRTVCEIEDNTKEE